jgi:hypothetical protein
VLIILVSEPGSRQSSKVLGSKELVAKALAHWKHDADLASIREPRVLETLPEGEREEWPALWAEVDALIAKVAKA